MIEVVAEDGAERGLVAGRDGELVGDGLGTAGDGGDQAAERVALST